MRKLWNARWIIHWIEPMLKLCKASFKFIKKKEQNNSKPTRKVSRVTCSKCSMVCIGLGNIPGKYVWKWQLVLKTTTSCTVNSNENLVSSYKQMALIPVSPQLYQDSLDWDTLFILICSLIIGMVHFDQWELNQIRINTIFLNWCSFFVKITFCSDAQVYI